jgi:hypothetical protein
MSKDARDRTMKAKFPQAFAAVAIVLALFTATALAQTR